ncbi:MAG: DNA-directed RNA polymerase subunit alpha C-terminal domain-containing protein [Patescibacteria group bacterium]
MSKLLAVGMIVRQSGELCIPLRAQDGNTVVIPIQVVCMKVAELDASVRMKHACRDLHIRTILDLVLTTEEDLMSVRNFGRRTLIDLIEKLGKLGMSLNMILVPPDNP